MHFPHQTLGFLVSPWAVPKLAILGNEAVHPCLLGIDNIPQSFSLLDSSKGLYQHLNILHAGQSMQSLIFLSVLSHFFPNFMAFHLSWEPWVPAHCSLVIGVFSCVLKRYQFLEEAFQNQKGAIENLLAKLLEKKNYVNFAAAQVQNRWVPQNDQLLHCVFNESQ